jgi:transcriptional regulator with XRE-family HTH domain
MRSTTNPAVATRPARGESLLALRLGPRGLARRERQVWLHVGRQIEELRTEAGISRAVMARAAAIDPAYLLRIEAGRARPSARVLVAISAALGADLGIRLFPGSGPRVRDRFQAPMIEALLRSLAPVWRAQPEVPLPKARGVADVVLDRSDISLGIEGECHSELRQLERVIRRSNEKTLALGELGTYGAVSNLLLLRSTTGTRDIARLYEQTLRSAFPARMDEAVASLGDGAPWPGPALVWARVEGGRGAILDHPPRGVRLGR